jgi:hypothetical protein
MEMDDVIKWFILVLVFVFDPLAVSLIVAANMLYLKRPGHEEQAEFTDHFVNKAKALNALLNKEVDPEIAKHLNDFTKINSEDIKPEISNVVDEHFDELLKPQKEEGGDTIVPLEDKKPPIIRRWKSANWRE